MAIANYTDLQNAVIAWLDVGTGDLSAIASNLIMVGEKRIMREVRTEHMEASLSSTISSGTINVPADFKEFKHVYIDGSPTQPLEIVSPSVVYERHPSRSSSGKPKMIARDAGVFIFGPYPDSGYAVKGTYYKTLDAVQTSANALFLANPDLYLMASLAESEPTLGRDARVQMWESKYRMVRDAVITEYSKARFGGPMAMKAVR